MKCSCCGKELENVIDGEDIGYVCSECLESDFTCCNDCGEWVQNDNICTAISNRGNEVYLCEQCCDDSYSYCTTCERYVKNEEGTDETFDGEWRVSIPLRV